MPHSVAVAVVGSSQATDEEAELAERVGALLAERGVTLICGGRGGVMEAACRGASRSGGITVGLLPGNDTADGNAYLTIAIPTGLGQARNALVAQSGKAVIAIGGGFGTLSEIALGLKAGRRVVGLKTWDARDMHGRAPAIEVAETPEQAVELALLAL